MKTFTIENKSLTNAYTWVCVFVLLVFSIGATSQVTQNYTISMKSGGNPLTGTTQLKETDNTTASWTKETSIAAGISANKWSGNITLPFAFKFFGETVTACKVTANGLLTFNTATTTVPSGDNGALPSSSLPTKTIACFWDQFAVLTPTGADDYIYTRTYGTTPNRQFWIKWNSFKIGNTSGNVAYNTDFAIVFEEATNVFYIVDEFKGNTSETPTTTTTTLSLSATIGAQYNTYYYAKQTATGALAGASTAYTDNLYYKFTPTAITDNSLSYSYTDLSTCGSSTSPISRTFMLPASSVCSSSSINTCKLYASLNLGTDYKYGSTGIFSDSTGATLSVTGYNSSGTSLFTGSANLYITQTNVEKLYQLDVTSYYSSLSYIVASISNFKATANTNVRTDLSFTVGTTSEYKVNVSSATVTLNTVSTSSSPVAFSWSSSCSGIPKYEFQLLRLFNKNKSYKTDVTKAKGTIDWTKALDLIIENNATSINLHLTEGSGYYAWRVRPIGNYYDGEEANNSNWGTWSTSYAQNASYDLTSSTIPGKYAFYYTEFDASINWIFNRTFSENNNIGENISYGDGLGREKQTQHHIQADDHVLVSQKIYDYSGRPALTTMAAPISRDYFDYAELFLTSDAAGKYLYRAKDFDSTTTYNNPSPVLAGNLNSYYSNSNADKRIPTADGYPFNRTLFYSDGTNRPKEISTPGSTFRIGSTSSGEDRTIKVYYTGVSDDELVAIFGDEAPVDTSVCKIIQIDPNKVISVAYKTVDGKTIATCLADGGDNALLDDISNDPLVIVDTILGSVSAGTYSYYKEKSVIFTVPTVLWATYNINPSEIEATCGDYCSTCDYTIYGYVKKYGEVIWDTTITIPASACNSTTVYSFSHSFTTEVAGYTVGRMITVNNEDPSTGYSYLETHQDTMAAIMDAHLDENFSAMYAYLEAGDVDGFYQFAIDSGYATQSQIDNEEDFTITTSCCSITIPVTKCPPHPCDAGTPDFEELIYDLWEDKYGNAFQNYSRQSSIYNYPDNGTLNKATVTVSTTHNGTYMSGDCQTYFNFKILYIGADGSSKIQDYGDICLDDWMLTSSSTTDEITQAVYSELYDLFMNDTKYSDNDDWPYFFNFSGYGSSFEITPNLSGSLYKGVMSGTCLFTSPNFTFDLRAASFSYTASGSYPYGIGAFNELVGNMIDDGYDCDSLYYYWYALATNFETLQFDTDGEEKDFNIVDAFLESAKTMYGDTSLHAYGTDADPGYFTHAYKCIYYNKGTCPDCETNYHFSTLLASNTYDDTRTENDSTKDWLEFYNCTQSCSSGSVESLLEDMGDTLDCRTYDYGCVEDLVETIEDSCYSLCAARAGSFENEIRAEYAAVHIAITDAEVACLVEALIAECESGCGLTIYHTDTLTTHTASAYDDRIDSVGNPYEIQAMQAALTYSFDITIPIPATAACGSGYKKIVTYTAWLHDLIIDTLNEYLSEYVAAGNTTLTYSVLKTMWSKAYATFGLAGSNCDLLTNSKEYFTVNASSYFYVSGKILYLSYSSCTCADNILFNWNTQPSCDKSWSCGPICFKWEVPTLDETPDTVEISTCEENAANYLMGIMDEQMQDCKDHYIEDITESYTSNCASPSSIDDYLVMGYTLGYFHYTLFYYDRGGNLIETVPPVGVDDQNNSRSDAPNNPSNSEGHYHTYKTTYEYNSRQLMTEKQTPDGGETKYYYNDLGLLRFSQSAQQASDNKYSYLKYDNLGRVTEAAQGTICRTCAITSASQLSSKVNLSTVPSTAGEEEIYTVYNDAASSISYTDASAVTHSQRFLTNRISYVYTDEDGSSTTTTDRNYTYYSYDPHGDVEWLIQSVAGLSNKQIGFEYDLISGKITKVKYQEGQSDQYFYKYFYDADNRLTSVQTSRDDKIYDTDATYTYYQHGPVQRVVIGEDKIQGLDYIYTLQGWLKAVNHPQLTSGYDYGQDGVSGTTNQNIPADAFGLILNYYKDDFARTSSQFNNNLSTSTMLYKLSTTHGGYSSSSTDMKSYYTGLISNTTSANGASSTLVTKNAGQPMVNMYLYDELGRLTQSTVDFFSGSAWHSIATGSKSDYYEHFQYDENGNITGVIRNAY